MKNLKTMIMLLGGLLAFGSLASCGGDDELPREDYRITLMDTDSRNSRIMLNLNSRLSVTYNWPRWYICVKGNFYHSRYSYDSRSTSGGVQGKNSGRLNDWSVNANIGFRL